MRKLVIALLLLAAVALAAPPAQAAPILQWAELGFKSSFDGSVYDTPYGSWPPPSADFSAFNFGTGLGSISFTFSGPGAYYVGGLFDYQIIDLDPCGPQGPPCPGNGIFDELAGFAGLMPAGWSLASDDPWAPTSLPSLYDQLVAFDATHPFANLVWASPGHDVAVAFGYAFTLNAGAPAREVIFTVSRTAPAGFYLMQTDEPSGEKVYFTGSSRDAGSPVIPEPGTMLLLGSGLIACARRLRRR